MSTRGSGKSGGATRSSGLAGKPKYGGRSRASGWTSKRPVGGRGLFITCVRGKEGRSVTEMYDILEEVADRLYPPERLAALELLNPPRPAPAVEDGEEDLNKATLVAHSGSEEEEEDEEEDQSIEASIARELAALRSARPSRKKWGADGDKSAGVTKPKVKGPKPRFQSLETHTECLAFIAIARPYDPVELAEAIVLEIQESGVSRARFTMRLQPVVTTCHALSVDAVKAVSDVLIQKHFKAWSLAHNKTYITYQIEPAVRVHTEPLSRHVLIETLGASIRSLALPPTDDSPVLTVAADLTSPDLVLIPVVFKNCYGLSIVEGKLWSGKKGKKFNLAEVAVEARKALTEAEGPTAVRGVEVEIAAGVEAIKLSDEMEGAA